MIVRGGAPQTMQALDAGFAFIIPQFAQDTVLDGARQDALDGFCTPPEPLSPENDALEEAIQLLDNVKLQYPPLSPQAIPNDHNTPSPPLESCDTFSLVSEDLWAPEPAGTAKDQSPALCTWDGAYGVENVHRYLNLSGAGSSTYDAALSWAGESRAESLDHRELIDLLVRIGLGRDTSFCKIGCSDEPGRLFDGIAMSGYSSSVLNGILTSLIRRGDVFRRLRVEAGPGTQRDGAEPAAMALLCNIQAALDMIEDSILLSAHGIMSLLQLESLFRDHERVLDAYSSIIGTIRTTDSDIAVVSRIYRFLSSAAYADPKLQVMLEDLLKAVTRPWNHSLMACLHLLPFSMSMLSSTPSFISNLLGGKYESVAEVLKLNCEYDPEQLPPLLTPEGGRLAFEGGCLLMLLKEHCPEHPLLLVPSGQDSIPLNFDWGTTWLDLENQAAQVRRYELEIFSRVRAFERLCSMQTILGVQTKRAQQASNLDPAVADADQSQLQTSIDSIEAPVRLRQSTWCYFQRRMLLRIEDRSTKCSAGPTVPMIPSLSLEPWICAQHRLANRACLWLLFKRFDLRSHLTLLQRFFLFSDGLFVSRLCHALFSPDLPTSERNVGQHRARQLGLRLGSRKLWPPASSELSLALAGILKDSYLPQISSSEKSVQNQEMPGKLSFAIREMAEEDIQRCLNPDSVFAIDFLCLQFRPPIPLDTIIATDILSKYDASFRLLLRAKRMQFVVNRLTRGRVALSKISANSRTYLKMCHLCQQLVASLNQFFSANVSKVITAMNRRLQEIEESLEDGNIQTHEDLYRFRDFHMGVLDGLREALFDRKRYTEVLKLINDMFETILHLAKLSREGPPSAEISKELYDSLAMKTSIFIRVCKGLVEDPGHQKTVRSRDSPASSQGKVVKSDMSPIRELLLILQMNDFFGT